MLDYRKEYRHGNNPKMITMMCWSNSKEIRFESLLFKGCKYKSEKKKHLQNEWTHDSETKFGKISAQPQAEMVIII